MKKLKKTILIVLMIFAAQSAFGAPALALGTPMAVQGQVTLNGTPADGASVVVTDANTGAFLTDTVGPTGNSLTSGYYSVDLGNLSIAAANGDVINIVATINGFSGNTSFVYNSAAGFVTPAVIAISSPVATQLAFTTQPSASAVNNALFAPQPVVEIQGAGGQIINTATTTISINAYTDSACLNLALNAPNGTLSVAAAAGQAIFTNLSYSLATPPAAGIIYLGATATAGALTPACSNAINIYVPATTSITVTPPTASILAGNTQQFSAVAYDQFGAAINPQPTFAWTSASTSIATISAAGLATGVSAGTATITATSGAVSGSSSLTVNPSSYTITSSAGANGAISPLGAVIVSSGASQVFAITPNAGYNVADVLADGVSVGAVTTYTFSNVMANHTIAANFSAAPPVLTSITVSPATATTTVGSTQQFTATALDQFGVALAVQPTFTWTSASTSIATISAAGLATGVSAGTTTITAASGAVSGSASVTVTMPTFSSIIVTPATATTTPGGTKQFTATAYDQNGTALTTQPTFIWTSASTSIATISAAGLATGVSAGTATITAASGTVSGSATLNVEAPILTGINVSPNKGIVKIGSTLQLHASGLDQSGLPLASQPAFTWTSASTTIASVSSNGLVTGLAVGTSTITATSGTVSGSATITVSTSTRIELLCDDKVEIEYELENNGALIPEINDDYASTTALTATHDILIRMLSGQGEYEIEMPAGVRISREDGASINGRSLTATTTVSGLSGLGSEEIKGAVKWGIPNVGLNFSLPITLRIFVGAALNGQTVNIVRSTSGSGGWTSAGIVAPATSLVVNGLATFQATKASYYAATMPAPAPAQGGGGGGGTSGVIVGGTVISTQSSSAPAATAEQQSSTSANTDQTAYVQPRVLGEKIYSNGQLIRGTNMKIYVIVNGMKKRIINLEELKKYKGKTIYNVSVQILAAYPEVLGEKIYANGSLIKTPDKKIYVIAGGKAKHIINLQELQKYRGKKIIKVNYEALINYES